MAFYDDEADRHNESLEVRYATATLKEFQP